MQPEDNVVETHSDGHDIVEQSTEELNENEDNTIHDNSIKDHSDCSNPSFLFQDLITDNLQTESSECLPMQPSSAFRTNNPDFYPIHSSTTSLELFQEKVEEELMELHNCNKGKVNKHDH